MKFNLRIRFAAVGLALVPALCAAQAFPAKPVTVVVLTGAGGVFSNFARAVGQNLEKKWRQTVVIENRPGAGGLIASEYVNRAAPDGYTLLLGSDAISTFPIFMKSTRFDTEKDLSPISIGASSPYIIQINSKVPAKDFKEFIAYAKANPGKLNQGFVGASGQQLEAIIFGQRTVTDIVKVPYQGGAPAITALLANDIQFYFGSYPVSAPHFKSGALIPIATGGVRRHRSLPDVPTLKELGIDMTSGFWIGYFAPPGTPKALREQISSDIREALHNPEVAKPVTESMGLDVVASTVDEMATQLSQLVRAYNEAARAAKIEPQ